MRHHTLEIYGNDEENHVVATISSPAYGDAHEPAAGYLRRIVLNDGENRVIVGVYHFDRPLEIIKLIAREGIERRAK
jgi:hypothetical protein